MTQADLTRKIKTRLGWPSINLEVSDDAIAECINDALMKVRDYAPVEKYITVPLIGQGDNPLSGGYGAYVELDPIEDLDSVISVTPADTLNYPFMYDEFSLVNYARRGIPARIAIVTNQRSNVEAMLRRSWKVVGNRLYVDKYYNMVTIRYTAKISDVSEIEDAYYVDWILKYALACTKEVLSRIRGKFVIDSNPFKTDADTLAAEAANEKAALEENLETRNIPAVTR